MEFVVSLYVSPGYLDRPEVSPPLKPGQKPPPTRRQRVEATGCIIVEDREVDYVHSVSRRYVPE